MIKRAFIFLFLASCYFFSSNTLFAVNVSTLAVVGNCNPNLNFSKHEETLQYIQSTLDQIKIKSISDQVSILQDINQTLNNIDVKDLSEDQLQKWKQLMIQRSISARQMAEYLMEHSEDNKAFLEQLCKESFEQISIHIKSMVDNEKITKDKAANIVANTRKFINEWLDPEHNIPLYIRTGIYRGMIEGRWDDLEYAFGFGWRQFGTAGIRNQAVNSKFEVLADQELDEFSEDVHAPILTGPNLMNTVTLLQQVSALVKLVEDLEGKIKDFREAGKSDKDIAKDLNISVEFFENVMEKTFTIAYDSRINGKYWAHLLAAAFLECGMKVNLFDAPSGVPPLVAAAKGSGFFGDIELPDGLRELFGSIFGILISASHSESNYNGFKAFVGHEKAQVDKATKQMIMDARAKVTYKDIQTRLDRGELAEFDNQFRKFKEKLTWFGRSKKNKDTDYCDAKFVDLYTSYFEYIAKRSPLEGLEDGVRSAINITKRGLKILYSAFFGAGATNAANVPEFLAEMGYEKVQIVKNQTENMDGKFPGHDMPDPGVVEGWMSNFYNFLQQQAGEKLGGNLVSAIQNLNSIEISCATDPDIDRAGFMLSLPDGVQGNMKQAFIDWMKKTLKDEPDDILDSIIKTLEKNMQDKFLLTANDAWTMLAFNKLKIMEEQKMLGKDKVYTILKSHATTDGLHRVAEYFREKGYHIYVVDTYVGFTELAKKNRDLFDIAQTAWDIRQLFLETESDKDKLNELVKKLKQQNQILKTNVPYGTAGVEFIDKVLESLESKKYSKQDLLEKLSAIAYMENILGCEESNGYGEFGSYNPEKGVVENAHISDKDGTLAIYEFLEMLSYAKDVSLSESAGYDMFKEMISEIGYFATDNQFLKYPGLTGVMQKEDAINNLANRFAALIQKGLDSGKEVMLVFNENYLKGKYKVKEVIVFRDKKYDVSGNGFAEEGIRLILETPKGNSAIVTFRPSGTGDNNRVYSWILGRKPEEDIDLEVYRQEIVTEFEELRADFFSGLLTDLKEKGTARHEEVFKEYLGGQCSFIDDEQQIIKTAQTFASCTSECDIAVMTEEEKIQMIKAVKDNFDLWKTHLDLISAKSYPKRLSITINDAYKVDIPNMFVKSLLPSLAGFLAVDLIQQGYNADTVKITCEDEEVLNEIKFQMKKLEKMSEKFEDVRSYLHSA